MYVVFASSADILFVLKRLWHAEVMMLMCLGGAQVALSLKSKFGNRKPRHGRSLRNAKSSKVLIISWAHKSELPSTLWLVPSHVFLPFATFGLERERSVGHMRPKCCPAAKNGRLGGRATTWEAVGYIIKLATAQDVPPRPVKTALRFTPKQ